EMVQFIGNYVLGLTVMSFGDDPKREGTIGKIGHPLDVLTRRIRQNTLAPYELEDTDHLPLLFTAIDLQRHRVAGSQARKVAQDGFTNRQFAHIRRLDKSPG